MEITLLLQLLGASLSVYNKATGKDTVLGPEEAALLQGLPVLINNIKAILAKPEYKTLAMQLQLAMDMAEIREAIGAPPAPDQPKE